jgi:hypothetical protein
VPAGLRSFALGRLRVLAARKGPPLAPATSAESRAGRAALGEMILAVDGALASLSTRDAQRVAKLLADVAEEAMVGAAQARAVEGGQMGIERLDRALFALRSGAEQLTQLGTLGNDLGSVALADLGRVQRARDARDFFHAELAARHLADRLRRPTPSFGASGPGGVEAGGGAGSSEPSHGDEPSEAERAFDQLARQIAELARDHASAVENVDQALADARAAGSDDALKGEAERRAQSLREAVEGLPEPGRSPGSADAAAALGREHARAMAYNLESLRLGEAVESGRRAVAALQEAITKSDGSDPRLAAQSDAARLAVEEQLAWVESQLEAARSAARERARSALSAPAQLEERLAGTAASLARRGENEKTPLPSDVTERLRQADQLMRQAARELSNGDGEAGLELQRQAQRLLESADRGKTSDEPSEQQRGEGKEDDDSGRLPGFGGEVPGAADQNKAEQFRRRVLESLGDGSGRFAPAIKRYAEGLLR